MSTTSETKERQEPTTTPATREDADVGRGELVKSTLASRLNQRVDLLQRILSFHSSPNPKQYINLRSSSKLFHRALPPPPCWTSFPHSNHTTLQSLLDHLEQLRGDKKSSSNVPSVLFIAEGDHEYTAPNGQRPQQRHVAVNFPLSIYGAGRAKTTLKFGLKIGGKKSEGPVVIADLKIQEGKGNGFWAAGKMNLVIKNVSVVDCQFNGVFAYNADVSCDNLQVVGCNESGLFVENACGSCNNLQVVGSGLSGVCAGFRSRVFLSGKSTTVRRNAAIGTSSYGVELDSSSSLVQLVAPLTIDTISTSNGGRGNWGGSGTIEQVVEKDGVVLQILYQGRVERGLAFDY